MLNITFNSNNFDKLFKCETKEELLERRDLLKNELSKLSDKRFKSEEAFHSKPSNSTVRCKCCRKKIPSNMQALIGTNGNVQALIGTNGNVHAVKDINDEIDKISRILRVKFNIT
jgi:hypothetical protein